MLDNNKDKFKLKMKAKMEAKHWGCGNMEGAYNKIKEMEEQMKTSHGDHKHYIRFFIDELNALLFCREDAIAHERHGLISE